MYNVGDEIIILDTECTDLESGQICHIISTQYFSDAILIGVEEYPNVYLNSIRFAGIKYTRKIKMKKLKLL